MPDVHILNLTQDAWRAVLPAPPRDERRVMVYVSGGLESEREQLTHARRLGEWCGNYGISPVYVLWQTDLLESLRTLVRDARRKPNLYPWDGGLNLLTERVVRRSQAPAAWAEIRAWAQVAAARSAALLGSFWQLSDMEIHIAAHGPGALLAAYLVRQALGSGLGSFRNLFMLGPALRIDCFETLLAPLLGNGVDRLTVYAQRRETELTDRFSRHYTRSLLYLISHALEPEYNVPLLGLEDSLRGNARVAARTGLAGVQASLATVEWIDAAHSGLPFNPQVLASISERIEHLPAEQVVCHPDEHQYGHAHDDREPGKEGADEQPIAA